MNRKIFLILSLVGSCFFANSQKLQEPNTFGYAFQRVIGDTLSGIASDTFSVPAQLKSRAWLARKSNTLYMWSTTNNKWEIITSVGAEVDPLSIHLTGASTQTGNILVAADGNQFKIDSVAYFNLVTPYDGNTNPGVRAYAEFASRDITLKMENVGGVAQGSMLFLDYNNGGRNIWQLNSWNDGNLDYSVIEGRASSTGSGNDGYVRMEQSEGNFYYLGLTNDSNQDQLLGIDYTTSGFGSRVGRITTGIGVGLSAGVLASDTTSGGVQSWVRGKKIIDSLAAAGWGSGGTPGGSNKQIQYNNSSSFGGATGFEYGNSGTNVQITQQATSDTALRLIGAASATTSNILLVRDGSGIRRFGVKGNGYIDLSAAYEPWYSLIDEISANLYGGFNYTAAGTGSSATFGASPTGSKNWIGTMAFATGTTNSGSGTWIMSNGGANSTTFLDGTKRFNYGTKIRLPNLSDGTDTYLFWCGLGNNFPFSSSTASIYFRYTHADSSGQFIIGANSGGSRTEWASGVTVAVNTDYELEWTLNPSDGNVYYYINDVFVGTVTSNIPTTSTSLFPIGQIVKSAGTTSRTLYVDWVGVGIRKY